MSINPFRELPLYTHEMIEKYRGRSAFDPKLPPHMCVFFSALSLPCLLKGHFTFGFSLISPPIILFPLLSSFIFFFPPSPFAYPLNSFALADTVFNDMRYRGRDQVVIISGESGAGKTEASKKVRKCGALDTCIYLNRGDFI